MIKEYLAIYKAHLLRIFDSNVPDYFDHSERQHFENFLNKMNCPYFVYLDQNEVIGAGGFVREKEGDARIVWLMVDRNKHSSGVGRAMMEFFEERIKAQKTYEVISLMTSQHTDVFYEKMGYKTTKAEDDYWAKGMHLRYMEKRLNEHII